FKGAIMRIPLVRPDDLSPELRTHYDRNRLDIILLNSHARTIYPPAMEMGQAIFSTSTIPPREREMAVLLVARLSAAEYPWRQHVDIAESLGVSQDKIAAIAREEIAAAVFDAQEQALLAFTRQVVESVRVDQA